LLPLHFKQTQFSLSSCGQIDEYQTSGLYAADWSPAGLLSSASSIARNYGVLVPRRRRRHREVRGAPVEIPSGEAVPGGEVSSRGTAHPQVMPKLP